jgi:hypothetical protein
MKNFKAILSQSSQVEQVRQLPQADESQWGWVKKLRGLVLLGLGYLLSPLSWWNDLFFNLPIAYGFGYICSWFSEDLLLPGSIVGYWLSNILGILLMQVGAVNVFGEQSQERNFKKELLTGLVSSSVYTVFILLLVHFQVLDTPNLLAGEHPFSLGSFLAAARGSG